MDFEQSCRTAITIRVIHTRHLVNTRGFAFYTCRRYSNAAAITLMDRANMKKLRSYSSFEYYEI